MRSRHSIQTQTVFAFSLNTNKPAARRQAPPPVGKTIVYIILQIPAPSAHHRYIYIIAARWRISTICSSRITTGHLWLVPCMCFSSLEHRQTIYLWQVKEGEACGLCGGARRLAFTVRMYDFWDNSNFSLFKLHVNYNIGEIYILPHLDIIMLRDDGREAMTWKFSTGPWLKSQSRNRVGQRSLTPQNDAK